MIQLFIELNETVEIGNRRILECDDWPVQVAGSVQARQLCVAERYPVPLFGFATASDV